MDYRIYSIHGTFASDSSQRGHHWWQKESHFSDEVLSYLDTKSFRVKWEPFRWSGDNKVSKRREAAELLADSLSQVDHEVTKTVLLAHSHGGNVAQSALDIASDKRRTNTAAGKVPFISIGTPFLIERETGNAAINWFLRVRPGLMLVAAVCLIGLLLTQENTVPSLIFAWSLIGLTLYFVISLFFMIGSWVGRKIYNLPHYSWLRKLVEYVFDFVTPPEGKQLRVENRKNPKIYSIQDEAINALRSAPRQQLRIARKQLLVLPMAMLVAATLIFAGFYVLPLIDANFELDAARDLASIMGEFEAGTEDVINETAIFLFEVLLAFSIGFLLSRWFLAQLASDMINYLFTKSLKERAFGRDVDFTRPVPMSVSSNLYNIHSEDQLEDWKPLPKSLDDELDEITIESASKMFKSIRASLGMGLTTGSYSFSEAISTNFRGDELIHSAYFEHPDMPGFIAWILCERYEFPKSARYEELPISKFKAWWDAISPEPAPELKVEPRGFFSWRKPTRAEPENATAS